MVPMNHNFQVLSRRSTEDPTWPTLLPHLENFSYIGAWLTFFWRTTSDGLGRNVAPQWIAHYTPIITLIRSSSDAVRSRTMDYIDWESAVRLDQLRLAGPRISIRPSDLLETSLRHHRAQYRWRSLRISPWSVMNPTDRCGGHNLIPSWCLGWYIQNIK